MTSLLSDGRMAEAFPSMSIVAHDRDWQTPAITEKHAYDRVCAGEWVGAGATYVGFPWASLIDGANRQSELGERLRLALRALPTPVNSERRVTVCQHIKFRDHLDSFRQAGITDIFASHAVRGERVTGGINIHPFPLFPAQMPESFSWMESKDARVREFLSRQHLYSFVGAYDPKWYMTPVREWIFALPEHPAGLVVRRSSWHYDRLVYDEQVLGGKPCPTAQVKESDNASEYKQVLATTRFSLCPSGSGPNSIRLWESMEFGCIPVILADDLQLPGDRAQWEKACVIVSEDEASVRALPEELDRINADPDLIGEKLRALEGIRHRYGRDAFVTDVVDFGRQCVSMNPVSAWQSSVRRVYFHLSGARGDESLVVDWLRFIARSCEALGLRAQAFVDVELSLGSLSAVKSLPGLELAAHDLGSPVNHDWVRHDLVTLCDSAPLSRPLLERFDRFQVRCVRRPLRVNPSLFHLLSGFFDADEGAIDYEEWQPICSLITSMYNGDEFAEGFLCNSAELQEYANIEHLIVLPESPGHEHSLVGNHVERWGNAVYIWMHADPRLYGVWNQCCMLASAPYLSNANIDDRRAPTHVTKLVEVLDASPQVDAASSALRVTSDKNLEWHDSEDCQVWYANEPFTEYGGDRLIKVRAGNFVPYNMPHCMPVWRKRLHGNFGFFDEERFGPSADWEFWLRAGARGTRFSVVSEALGLYLRAANSYWQKNSAASQFDQRIIETYGLREGASQVASQTPYSSILKRLVDNRNRGQWLAYTHDLIRLLGEASSSSAQWPALGSLLETLLKRDFGLHLSEELIRFLFPLSTEVPETGPAVPRRLAIEAMHALPEAGREHDRIIENLGRLLAELQDLCTDIDAVLAEALMARLAGDLDREARCLRRAIELDAQEFWFRLQTFYRFSVPLQSICEQLPSLAPFADIDEFIPEKRLYFFPDYTHGNPYQRLLYKGLDHAGSEFQGVDDLQLLISGQLPIEGGDVLHIHWLNILSKGVEPDRLPQVFDEFLSCIEELKMRGVRIVWTVHNRYSHDLPDIAMEGRLRTQLAKRADTVLLHHPCLQNELSEWLPADANVRFLEHGHYLDTIDYPVTCASARRELGLNESDFVVCVTGQVRPYKDLAQVLRAVRDAMRSNGRLKLVLAGKVVCDEARMELARLPEGQTVVKDGYVEDSVLQLFTAAADFVMLSYRDILTSGSLFQAFSFGRPVLAPGKGSLPAYVVDTWNGYIYKSSEHLSALLRALADDQSIGEECGAKNALQTALGVRWPESPTGSGGTDAV